MSSCRILPELIDGLPRHEWLRRLVIDWYNDGTHKDESERVNYKQLREHALTVASESEFAVSVINFDGTRTEPGQYLNPSYPNLIEKVKAEALSAGVKETK